MDWDDLRYILAIARAGTLAAAARRLGVDQTTVARRLAAAEATLGRRLYERRDGALHPTKSGEAAIARAAEIEQGVHALAQGNSDRDIVGLVRLTAVPVLANCFVVPALPQLRARHPRLQLELIAEARNFSVTKREADIALRLARPEGTSSLLARRVGHLAYAVYGRRRNTPKDLPWLSFEEGLGHLPQARWIAAQHEGEIAPLRFGDTETILAAVRAGLGKSLLPRFVADSDPHLTCLSGPGVVLSRELWLLVHRELRRTTNIAAVVDWLAELAKARLSPKLR